MGCGGPSCIAIVNVIAVHLIILTICFFSWIDLLDISSLLQTTALGFATLVWFAISGIFVLWNLVIFIFDKCGCPLGKGMRIWCAHYGCLFLTYGEDEDDYESDDDDDFSDFGKRKKKKNVNFQESARRPSKGKSFRSYEEEDESTVDSEFYSYDKYYRFLLVVLFLVGEGFLIIFPFFPLSFLENDLNNGLMTRSFGTVPPVDAELIEEPFDFIKYTYPGPLALTGDYSNVDAKASASTYEYKTDGTVCVPACELDVIRPAGQTILSPVIFHVHGGGWNDGDKTDPNTPIGFWLDRGYAFVSVQYRFPNLSPGATIYDIVSDVQDAWLYIKQNGADIGLDASNVIFYGEEAGGHLATLVSYRLADSDIRGVINMYGITEWEHYHSEGKTKLKTKFFDNVVPTTLSREQVYADMSSSKQADENSPPTLTIHGKGDRTVPIFISEHLHENLTAKQVPNFLLAVPFEMHNLDFGWYSKGGQISAYAMDQFFAMFFKNS